MADHSLCAPICANEHAIGMLCVDSAGKALFQRFVILDLRQLRKKRERSTEPRQGFSKRADSLSGTVDDTKALIPWKGQRFWIVEAISKCSIDWIGTLPVGRKKRTSSPMRQPKESEFGWRNGSWLDPQVALASNAERTSRAQRLFETAFTDCFGRRRVVELWIQSYEPGLDCLR